MITRFPGSVITGCQDKRSESYPFSDIGPKKERKVIEGEYHFTWYKVPEGTGKAQVVRNLLTALQTAGYTKVQDDTFGDFTFYMGKTWIKEEVGAGSDYQQHILIETQLTQEIVATAADLSNGLTSAGHTVVNGILFDTGKADVKPESAAALQEIVKLLKQDAKVKIYVVGHTDNVGALAANIDLSRRRAAAIVQVLTAQYGVAADRLQPYGAGPYMPRASNDSEDGRTLNRRVELVKQ
ncbi:MAG TPA: OmpA family protein [Bryobacteraceae bacterium]|nr:OmpA family protein [Bryobacteraceae bacterium]